MARYIDADKLKIGHTITDIYGNAYGVRDYVTFRDIDNAPTEDVRPVVRGKWISRELYNVDMDKGRKILVCSKCDIGIANGILGFANFCPNCGADMREVEE